MNVIANNPQEKYVPWLVCMDANGDPLEQCCSEVGIDVPAATAPADLLASYLAIDAPITGTPTVYVDGSSVRTSYSAIKRALCKSDPSLSACAANDMPEGADKEITEFCNVPSNVEV
jgi:hypothetical protein